MILGVGPEFPFEVLSTEDWVARRLVADRFQDRRVFICGDAAHLWIPLGGYGMNAGIADAANLAWKLAGMLKGWASPGILDAYNAERQPITDQVSRLISDVAGKVMIQRDEISADIERQDAMGRPRVRASARQPTRSTLTSNAAGASISATTTNALRSLLSEESVARVYDGFVYLVQVPGCRVPHLWLDGHRSLYDALGPDYTLLRLDPTMHVIGIVEAAARRNFPLKVLDVKVSEVPRFTSTNSSWCAQISMWHGVATRNRTRWRTLLISSAARAPKG